MFGECLNFQGGWGEKIRENGSKTGNSLAMQVGKRGIPDQNFDKSSLVSIFRHSIAILSQYRKISPKK